MLEMASLSVEVMNRCVPIIVILGGTGTGKSKLGIQIAKRIGGEIISADSMQVYKGLNILTNKVTEEEKDGVVHHLLDFVEPPRTYTVVDFRNEALPIMDRLLEQKRSPVIVGGTNYYIESLLWKVLVADKTKENSTYESKEMENLAFRLGLRPMSGNSKRKSDETDKAPLDAKGRFVLTVREVCFMFGYPGKIIDLFYDRLKTCKEDVGKILVIKNLNNINDNADMTNVDDNLDNIDDERCPTCQSMKKTIVEVADLKQQTEGLVEKWQSSNPSLDLGGILKNCHNVDLKMVSAVEESLKDVHRQLSDLLVPWVQRLEAEFGKDFRLEIDVEDIPSPDLHKYLSQVDQQRAIYMHPNNKRKIIRYV
ncbi:tRNA dimethylallyltransferase [Nilaparvata lugens]|uniref:tRNA dimethylallyltransferase n=1 Tax=Nilaparvata lugens TaxID=108931 RepID=UPI00193E9971|nr:tRNA dimethylallyltransferase [Nilaparvata lugens]